MYKIGVIGDYDSICGFSALGLDIFPVNSAEEANINLDRLSTLQYGIIYVTEQYIENLSDVLEKYSFLPAVIPIPAVHGSTGFGINAVKKYVIQAVGADII